MPQLVLICLPLATSCFGEESQNLNQKLSKPLQNGFYAVRVEALTAGEVQCQDASCAAMLYDKTFTDSSESEPVKYVAIDTSSFVPFILEAAPGAARAGAGKMILRVKLKKKYAQRLEDFSRRHLGGTVAIVLDGEIVTLHKVRSVVSGGQVQITRCSDNACEVLKAKLTK
jgi:preprotein translocase subunit SecD